MKEARNQHFYFGAIEAGELELAKFKKEASEFIRYHEGRMAQFRMCAERLKELEDEKKASQDMNKVLP